MRIATAARNQYRYLPVAPKNEPINPAAAPMSVKVSASPRANTSEYFRAFFLSPRA